MSGNPRWARVVGYAMRACKDDDVPCHRVVHRDGTPARADDEIGKFSVIPALKSEGVEFLDNGKVNLEKHLWF